MGIRGKAKLAEWIGGLDCRQRLARWGRAAADLLYPPRCLWCDAELDAGHGGLLLCERCQALLGPAEWSGCAGCGMPVPVEQAGRGTCRCCRGRRWSFDTVVPLGAYRGGLQDAVLRTKHPAGEALTVALALLYHRLRGPRIAALSPTVVVPIPMHWLRRLSRRHSSPEILAEYWARLLQLPLLVSALQRRRNTALQRSLPPRQRFSNVRGAFRLQTGYDFRGARVILVDDVLTTGATCDAAARPLKQAGAALVAVAVLARAEGDS